MRDTQSAGDASGMFDLKDLLMFNLRYGGGRTVPCESASVDRNRFIMNDDDGPQIEPREHLHTDRFVDRRAGGDYQVTIQDQLSQP